MKSAYIDSLAFKGGWKQFHTRFHTSLHLRVRVQINGGRCRIQVVSDSILLQYSSALRKIDIGKSFTECPERSSEVSAVSTRGNDDVELEANTHSAASIVIF